MKIEDDVTMGAPPHKIKAKGRKAYLPGGDPMAIQPYRKGSRKYKYYLPKWLEGWREAEEEYHNHLLED